MKNMKNIENVKNMAHIDDMRNIHIIKDMEDVGKYVMWRDGSMDVLGI